MPIISSPVGANKTLSNLSDLGTAAQVLTSNGAGVAPTFQAAAGGAAVPQFTYKPEVTAAGNLSVYQVNGTQGYGLGLTLTTTATANSYSRAQPGTHVAYPQVFNGNNNFSILFHRSTTGTDSQFYIGTGGLADHGTALIFTVAQYGYKIIRAGGTDTVSATNADGTTETATGFAPNNVGSDAFIWMVVKTGTTDIKFYEGKTLRATHTTNFPAETDLGRFFHTIVNNANVASSTAYIIKVYTYNQDAY